MEALLDPGAPHLQVFFQAPSPTSDWGSPFRAQGACPLSLSLPGLGGSQRSFLPIRPLENHSHP